MNWAKLLRRTAAFFLSTVTLWWLAVTTNVFAVNQRSLLPGVGGIQASAPPAMGEQTASYERNGWERLLLSQSPFLRSGQVLTGRAEPGPTPSPLPVEPTPVPTPTPSPTLQPEDDTPLLSPPQDSAQAVIAQTLVPAGSAHASADGVFLDNRTSQDVDIEALAAADIQFTGTGNGPQILIVHTHATEAYTQWEQDVYEESDPYRTTDDAHNVVRVGDEMAAAFARAGLNVLHDRTLHDYPNYNGAYTRSLDTVREYLTAYPSISVVLDVHRDAILREDGAIYKTMTNPDAAEDCAQVMLVVGTQEAGGVHPNWRQNLAFAMTLEREMNDRTPTLARPITLRRSNYNQQLSVGSLLVEVGTHGNTIQEAINAARLFAQAAAPVIKDLIPR